MVCLRSGLFSSQAVEAHEAIYFQTSQDFHSMLDANCNDDRRCEKNPDPIVPSVGLQFSFGVFLSGSGVLIQQAWFFITP